MLRHALGVEGARQRAREARRVGQVDARRRDPLAQAPDERAAALGVRQPVEGQAAEELEQRADGVVLEHHRVLARRERDRLLAGDLAPPRAWPARRGRARRSSVPRAGRPARPPALVARDDLHEGVGHGCRSARTPVDEAMAVSTAPAVQIPNACSPAAAQRSNATRSASPAAPGSSCAVSGVEAVVAGARAPAPAGRGSRRARRRRPPRRARRPGRARRRRAAPRRSSRWSRPSRCGPGRRTAPRR